MNLILLISCFLFCLMTQTYAKHNEKLYCEKSSVTQISEEELSVINGFTMLMTDHEKALLLRHLRASKVYLEYGAGGSTNLACRVSKASNGKALTKFVSVESSDDFLNSLVDKSTCLRDAKKNGTFVPFYVNIGETKRMGVPKSMKTQHLFQDYSAAISKFNQTMPDLVLVDGRFRVACALSTILYNPSATVLIHDFHIRPYYHYILEYMDTIDCADTLIVLKAKKTIDKEALKRDIDKYNMQYGR